MSEQSSCLPHCSSQRGFSRHQPAVDEQKRYRGAYSAQKYYSGTDKMYRRPKKIFTIMLQIQRKQIFCYIATERELRVS